ncbi:vWA domain-containing protein [Moritella viscosa]|uniref:von Willebrand factor type A domain protein n=1 Tax=Moritella viscosa TaxID=80854 RepID=A0ABY1H8V8_9GAMM|nr:VWA domain-containing protein [Moritella viscosa]SGY86007.1 von Willebrand factor type A domain protein [Moritella viscosa]SGY87316.1 von Willebrand factor type A domain protein [Moritella viscosa]SGY89361.1 von Willebrand factor type A domain protein [Moritella viscosa]SHO24870.1 von Willebrand factor type A domain protein [Moritella viscosa]
MFEFNWPWLLLLLPLPLLIRFLSTASRPQLPLVLPNLPYIDTTTGTTTKKPRTMVLLTLMWLCLVIASARPMWIGEPQSVPQKGREMMLAVDLSGSMQMKDMQINNRMVDRLSLVKTVVADFIQQRKGDRVGLIFFADNAYLQAPLTFDLKTVSGYMQQAVLGLVGEKTAIGEGIGLALKRFDAADNPQKILILLTDGQNTAGEVKPLEAAKFAQEQGVKIYTIGVGADAYYQRTFFGKEKVDPSSDLDETTLKSIAAQTGGQYFRARDASSLTAIYAELDKLEPVEQAQQQFRPQTDLFHWPLAIALLLSILVCYLRQGVSHD